MARPVFAFSVELGVKGEMRSGRFGIEGLEAQIKDFTPVWPKVAEVVRAALARGFEQEGNVYGKWAPLTRKYGAWKARRFPGRKILHGPDRPRHIGGQLRDSLTRKGHPDAVQTETPTGLFISSDVPYATYHQHGTGRMVARPPLGLSDRDKASIAQVIHRYFMAGANKRPAVVAR